MPAIPRCAVLERAARRDGACMDVAGTDRSCMSRSSSTRRQRGSVPHPQSDHCRMKRGYIPYLLYPQRLRGPRAAGEQSSQPVSSAGGREEAQWRAGVGGKSRPYRPYPGYGTSSRMQRGAATGPPYVCEFPRSAPAQPRRTALPSPDPGQRQRHHQRSNAAAQTQTVDRQCGAAGLLARLAGGRRPQRWSGEPNAAAPRPRLAPPSTAEGEQIVALVQWTASGGPRLIKYVCVRCCSHAVQCVPGRPPVLHKDFRASHALHSTTARPIATALVHLLSHAALPAFLCPCCSPSHRLPSSTLVAGPPMTSGAIPRPLLVRRWTPELTRHG